MDKELQDLLTNYEKAIYGQVPLTSPLMHQVHLLLDYIANLEQQVKKQQHVIDKVEDLSMIKKARCLNENDYILNISDLDEILHALKEVK